MSQNSNILAYLKRGNSITGLEALSLFGTIRLASRIWDLEQLGYEIERKMISVDNGKRVMMYWLVKHKKPIRILTKYQLKHNSERFWDE